MRLEKIKNFEWYNEPSDVGFIEKGLVVETCPNTDFWQNTDCNFFKDDGHFFYQKTQGDFVLTAKWSFSEIKDSAQCGIMVRSDAKNWLKVGVLSPNVEQIELGVVVSNDGSSDWSSLSVPNQTEQVWFKIRRRGNDFVVGYALDEQNFKQIRMAHLSKISKETSVGAYACSPKEEPFCCVLEDIELKI